MLAVAFATSTGATFKCVDPKGVTRIGDTPPEECGNVVVYEISASGAVIKKIEPTPTPEQLKALEEDRVRKKESDRAAADQKRKDAALLASFSGEKEFDVARDRNIEPLVGRIKNNEDRLKEVAKRIKELEDEMEFYKAGKSGKSGKSSEPPPVLIEVMARSRTEKATLEKANVGYQKEIEDIKAKFEADKKRWVSLKTDPSSRNMQPEPAKAAVAGTMIPGAAGTANCAGKVYECQAGQTYVCRDGYRGAYKVNCVVERK
ncbi:MAG TPA: DUF4124 domain-containing protein [Usitatibacter sp.]